MKSAGANLITRTSNIKQEQQRFEIENQNSEEIRLLNYDRNTT